MFDELKKQVCEANLELVAQGLVTLTWGNVSGLSADGSAMAIKPSGVDYKGLRPEHMVVVAVASGKVIDGNLKPSSDAPTHRLLYQSFPGVGGIAHTHSGRAVAFAQARREIPCFGTTHADHFYGPVPLTRDMTRDEIEADYEVHTGRVIMERFAELDPLAVPGVLVASHGPFAWGRDAHDAVINAVALEASAAMALDTIALAGQDAPAVAQHLLDKHYFRKHGTDAYYGQR